MISIKNDGEITIAVGRSKTETKWKNKTMLWSELVEKLSHTTRTPETYQEYKKMSKNDKDRIKDVGGFVGGSLKNGRKKNENIQNRTLITLDIDYAVGDVWASIEMLYDFSIVMYSTHNHSHDNQRLRLVIPLSRPVLPDEYQAISRMVASDLGIDFFDDTTYQPVRLMYWPSTSSDGEYVFKYQDLKWLNPDDILARYTFGWEDISYWPESSRQKAHITSTLKKQGDPLSKPGLIGAFCRTYSISEAIEKFISDIYLPTTRDDRYTYAEGSTSAGVVIYEDKFSYSHHGTDPASMTLCNSFDLIRIHKFKELDESFKEDTPVNKLPSFSAMSEFAAQDKKVIKTINQEKIRQAEMDFDSLPSEEEDWEDKLDMTSKGTVKSTVDNILLIISNHPLLKGKIAYNQFSNRAVVIDKLPWRSSDNMSDWKDSDDAGLRHFLEKYYNISSTKKVDDALMMLFEKNTFHPIKDFFDTLEWDKKQRVETLLIDYLGAEDNSYSRVVIKKMLVAAVARIYNPGTKFDNMLILCGPQGKGKSTFIRYLGKGWYSDSLITVTGKEAYEQLQGNWLLEMAEMNATKKADVEATKHFLSKTEDIYRVAYGRRTTRFPRQCIFFGTSNDNELLRDKTGNRRFWPVDVYINKPSKNVFDDLNEYEVNQIWAEALKLYKNGEPLYLDEKEEEKAIEQQTAHSYESEKTGLITEYLDTPITDDWYSLNIYDRQEYIQGNSFGEKGSVRRDKICTMEIWVELFRGDPKLLQGITSREINDILKSLPGWKRSKSSLSFGKDYGRQRAFIREVN